MSYFKKLLKSINLLIREENPISRLDLRGGRNLIIAPHPDDEVIGCFSVLDGSDYVDILLITDGENGIENESREVTKRIRKKEFELGISDFDIANVFRKSLPDGLVPTANSVYSDVDLSVYKRIFVPNPFDRHPDHIATTQSLLQLSSKNFSKDVLICFYEVWAPLPHVNLFADISDKWKMKKEVIRRHESQCRAIDYATKILGLNNYRGMIVHKQYVEAFLELPLSESKEIFSKW